MKAELSTIQSLLTHGDFYNLKLLDSVDSTNTYLKDNYQDYPDHTVVMAHHQTKGRGRLSKSFHSPKGSGLYFTLLLKNPALHYDPGFLTMTAAVAVNHAMASYTGDSGIKWVNDIYLGDKKICGILTEAVFQGGEVSPSAILIGIGINVNTRDFPMELKNIATSMALHLHREFDLSEVAAAVLDRLKEALDDLAADKLQIVQDYAAGLKYINETVSLLQGKKISQVKLLGITGQGYLRVLEIATGSEAVIYSGEIKYENRKRRFDFQLPTHILFGPGSLDDLGGLKLPGTKALIVTPRGASAKALGYLQRLVLEFERGGLRTMVYECTDPNPTVSDAMAGSAMARLHGCDLIAGLGGGSALECAKAIALMAVNPGNFADYQTGGGGVPRTPLHQPLPVIAIPAAAGKGSEASQANVISNESPQATLEYCHDAPAPCIAVVDSGLMAAAAPRFTAYQGFDDLCHGAESILNSRCHPMVELFALKAVEYITEYLPRAVSQAEEDARYFLSLAGTYAGIYPLPLSAHTIAHSLAAHHPDLPHGAAVAMISREYHEHLIGRGAAAEQYIKLAKAMGAIGDVAPQDFLRHLNCLMEKCALADLRLQDFGILKEELPALAAQAAAAASGLTDPLPLTRDDILEILYKAYNHTFHSTPGTSVNK